MRSSLRVAFATFALLAGLAGETQGSMIVVPGSLAAVEGGSSNPFPFNLGSLPVSIPSQRYQQIYEAKEFSGPMTIGRILFRPDSVNGNAFSSTLPEVQINLSTTTVPVDSLNAIFSANVGANDTIVYNRGALSLSSADAAGPGSTRAFDIAINLTTPFLYDPSQGNLLLDIRNYGGGNTTFFDAQPLAVINNSMRRMFTLFGAGVNEPSGVSDGVAGLVTAFESATVATPEPASVALLGLASVGGIGLRLRRRGGKNDAHAPA